MHPWPEWLRLAAAVVAAAVVPAVVDEPVDELVVEPDVDAPGAEGVGAGTKEIGTVAILPPWSA